MKTVLSCYLVVAALALTLSKTAQGLDTEPSASTAIGGFCARHYQGCCDFTAHNCSVEGGCYCDQLCHWYGDCCDNITDVCPSGANSSVVTGNWTAAEITNSVIVVMADQSKVLRKAVELRDIAAQAVSDWCDSRPCASYANGSPGTSVETTGYNVTITSVLRNSPNTSQVVLYVTADNSSVVSAVDVVEALKANSSAHLKVQFVVYDIRVASSPSGNDINSSSEVSTSTSESIPVSSIESSSPLVLTSSPLVLTSSPLVLTSSPLVLTSSPLVLTSSSLVLTSSPLVLTSSPLVLTSSSLVLTSSSLVLSIIQPSVSATELPISSSSPDLSFTPSSSSSPSLVTPLAPSPSQSGHTAPGSPTAAPASNELDSQVIGLIVGGAVGGALISVMIVVVVITSFVRRLKAKHEQYREISFTQYPLSEDEGVKVKPKKKGKLVMDYEKLE
ncbi:hypothetical protein EMCRGX_G030045 [Ephydatia muelleri]